MYLWIFNILSLHVNRKGAYAPFLMLSFCISFPEASLHYLLTFDARSKFKYHICEFLMTNTLTIASCMMQLVCVVEGRG